jgi:hypothetical protein
MTVQRFGTSSAPCPNGLYVRHSDYAALVAECERLRMQQYELMGVVADVEMGNGFDAVCLETIKRVIGKLGGAA